MMRCVVLFAALNPIHYMCAKFVSHRPVRYQTEHAAAYHKIHEITNSTTTFSSTSLHFKSLKVCLFAK